MISEKPVILLLVLFIGIWGPVVAFGAGKVRQAALRDDFFLAGVDGKLTSTDSNESPESQYISFGATDRWFFKFDSDVSDDQGRIRAGAVSELLPSAMLEKMTANMKQHPEANYRLWGKVTKYKGKNFIFGIYFLPISETDRPRPSAPKSSQQRQSRITINDPNDAITIPKNLIEKLKTRRIVRTEQLLKGLELKQDFILADRTGLIVKQASGELMFVLDALGRNIQQQISLCLLPCQTLEWAQRKQYAELERSRFKVAGIVTKYKGKHYLLLQRAIRAYSHENFGR